MTVTPNIQSIVETTEIKIMQDNPSGSKFSLADWWCANWRGILSELVSTSMLVLFGCMACLPLEGVDTTLYGPFGFGFVVLFNIQIFGHISGAYMNPAVTFASMLWGSTPIVLGIIYIIVECAGALLGYGILVTLAPFDLVPGGVCVTGPYTGLTEFQTLGIEFALTAALSFVNCGVWDPVNKNKQDSIPIKFGLTIVGLSLVGGPLTGASMNPARSLGPAVWTNHWTHHWTYWVGPFAGSGLAAVFYKYVFLRKRGIE